MTMKYVDGQAVKVGDMVGLGSTDEGIVMCSIDTDESSAEQSADDWKFLKTGVMIDFPSMGLVHFPEEHPDLWLISRNAD
ncbi:hypothetical protein D3C87_1543490 [compost metagenome]